MDDRQTLRAAYLYYRAELTQAQVAERLGVSRIKVGRLLASAQQRGIVRIDIRHPLSRVTEMEVALEARYGLRDAVVAEAATENGEDQELRLLAVATAGAEYLAALRLSGTAIAVGWGTTMDAVSAALDEGWADDIDVFQLNGAVPVSGYASGAGEIMARFARRGNGRAHVLQVPAIVGTADARAALDGDRSVRAAIDGARTAPVAIFSLGRISRESVLVGSGYIEGDDVGRLGESGAVGDVISRFIGRDGSVVDADLDARTLGVELHSLHSRERAIGVAAGALKADVARAAIAGGYLNTLIVDDSLAAELLA